MKEDPSIEGGVKGELYEVSEVTLQILDIYECVDSGLFNRREIELENGELAFAYVFNGSKIHFSEGNTVFDDRIESGEWSSE